MKSTDSVLFFEKDPLFISLKPEVRMFIREKVHLFHLSFQNTKQLVDIASDLEMWGETDLSSLWEDHGESRAKGKDKIKLVMSTVIEKWKYIKENPKDYSQFIPETPKVPKLQFSIEEDENTLLGRCPVASDKTRCCNLETLDAVKSCGFACSYCSIQSFYTEGKIVFQKDFTLKLEKLSIDPGKIYHIGTGQSSDSLMWGNREGLLDGLFNFAEKNKNVILEFKTKSDNISYFTNHKTPSNILVTWSLNTQTIIDAEEHLTASLDNRLKAARIIADMGILVGFHFHPMVYYKNWEKEYREIFNRIQKMFEPGEVVLVSLGTLTFIKPVIKELRKHKVKSKILQMPLEDASGKFSYPLEIKRLMFKTAYDEFSSLWKDQVFFYMCMEDKSLWKDVFGYSYSTNEEFEKAMKGSYLKKIGSLDGKGS